MSTQLAHFLDLLLLVLNVSVLVALIRAKEANSYRALTALICLRLFSDLLSSISFELLGIPSAYKRSIYAFYFYTYWGCFAVDAILALSVIFGIFRLAMAPLKGLERLGSLVFRWALGISVALALLVGLSGQASSDPAIVVAVNQLQRISNVLTLCLLLFVCFAIRPMGLSYRSRVFGVSLGLGLSASTNLVCSAWVLKGHGAMPDVIWEIAEICTVVIWVTYFALPEPKARIIVLPTTSPYLRWNQISEALGDEPGFVAVAGVPPEVFSPAEVEIMFRASAKMRPLFDEPFVSGAGPEPSITSLTA